MKPLMPIKNLYLYESMKWHCRPVEGFLIHTDFTVMRVTASVCRALLVHRRKRFGMLFCEFGAFAQAPDDLRVSGTIVCMLAVPQMFFCFFLSYRFAISWRGEWVLQAVLFWDVGRWAEMGMELLIRWLRMMHMDYFWGQRGIRCCPDHYVVWRSRAFQNQLDIGSEAKRLQHHMTSALHEQKYIRLCTAGADVRRL